jgi:HK97 family phage major capsid protein
MDLDTVEEVEKRVINRIKAMEDAAKVAPEKHAKSLEDMLNDTSEKGFGGQLKRMVESILEKEFAARIKAQDEEHSRKLTFHKGQVTNPDGEQVFSLAKMFHAIGNNKQWGANAKFEQDICEKVMSEGTTTAGGFLVPEEYLLDIKERIQASTVVRQFGVTTYPMATDTLNIPRITGGATANWIGENTTITASDATLAQLQLVAKKLAAIVKLSTELMADSNPKVEMVIRRDLAKVMALAEDLAFLNGTASSTVPGGILTVSGTAEVTNGTNGGVPDFDTFYDALYQVELANGIADGWVMHPRTKNTLRQIKDSHGRHIFVVSPTIAEASTLFGIPVKMTTQLPIDQTVGSNTDCSDGIVGQWDEAVIGDRGFMEFAIDTAGTAFEDYQTWIRAIARLDFGLRTPGVFCKITGIRS